MKIIKLIMTLMCTLAFSQYAFADVTFSGSSTIHPIIKKSVEPFLDKTGINIHTQGGGSSKGVRDAVNGISDIGMVSRELSADEKEKLVYHTIGHDGIAVIANTANPVNSLTDEQIINIFSGKITSWKLINGKDRKITLVAKEEGRSTKELFEKFFSLKGKIPSNAYLIGSNAEDIMFVASDPYAIGYVSIGSAEVAHNKGIYIKPLKLNEIEASVESVASKKYPLRRPLNLVTKEIFSEDTKRFLDFILSKDGQKIVKDGGFIPVRP